jgi:hypothetical protein
MFLTQTRWFLNSRYITLIYENVFEYYSNPSWKTADNLNPQLAKPLLTRDCSKLLLSIIIYTVISKQNTQNIYVCIHMYAFF